VADVNIILQRAHMLILSHGMHTTSADAHCHCASRAAVLCGCSPTDTSYVRRLLVSVETVCASETDDGHLSLGSHPAQHFEVIWVQPVVP
jgi:hypothetical protein